MTIARSATLSIVVKSVVLMVTSGYKTLFRHYKGKPSSSASEFSLYCPHAISFAVQFLRHIPAWAEHRRPVEGGGGANTRPGSGRAEEQARRSLCRLSR